MSDPCAPEWADTIELCLGGDGAPADWERLRAHLAECAACKAWYDAEARLTALLAGEPDGLAPAAAAAGEARLLAALGAAEAAPPQPAKVLRFPTRRLFAGAGVLLAAAAAVLVWVNREVEPAPVALGGPPSGFQARGGEAAPPALGFRAFCIDTAGDAPQVRATAVADGPPVKCRIGDRLQVMWSATTPRPVYLGLVTAHADQLTTLRPPTGPALTEPGIIKRTWTLDVAGEITLYGIFADAPVEQPLTAAALRDAEGAPWPVHGARLIVEAGP